jgi:hypothetical protein
MKVEEAIVESARALMIFIIWGSILLLFGFENTVVFILIYSLIIKRNIINENSKR